MENTKKNIQNLCNNYYNFIINVLTTEAELYNNYFELSLNNKEQESKKVDEIIKKKIFQDILYDLFYNINNIRQDLLNAFEFWSEPYSKNEIIFIYNELKNFYKDFEIKEIEEVL